MNAMRRRVGLAAMVLGLVAGAAGQADAGLLTSMVNVSAYYPTANDVLVDPGNRVVTSGIEYLAGSFNGYNPTWQVDVTDDQFILSNTPGFGFPGFPFGSATFNGFILKVLSGPEILSATVDSSSGFQPVSVAVLNGNEIRINYSGVSGPTSVVSSVINITIAAPAVVPEPSTLAGAFLGVGLCGGGWWLRRRKHQAA